MACQLHAAAQKANGAAAEAQGCVSPPPIAASGSGRAVDQPDTTRLGELLCGGIPASASASSKTGWKRRFGATCCALGNERASVGRDGVGSGCTNPCGCSTATGFADRCRKSPQQDRSHKSWGEANRRAQCGKSACCVRRGGGWKRGTVEMV